MAATSNRSRSSGPAVEMDRDANGGAAYHEAGHAVMAVEVYGYGRLQRVWLEDTGDYVGFTALFRWDYIPPVWYWRSGRPVCRRSSETTEHLVWAHGLYCYAGAAAQTTFADDLDYGLASAQNDIWLLCDRVRESLGVEIPFPALGQFEMDPHGFFLEAAETILQRQWHAVEAVAQQLMERGSLDGREVDGIVGSLVRDDQHWIHGDRRLCDWLENHRPVGDEVCRGDEAIGL